MVGAKLASLLLAAGVRADPGASAGAQQDVQWPDVDMAALAAQYPLGGGGPEGGGVERDD